jgi:hypothetical protein
VVDPLELPLGDVAVVTLELLLGRELLAVARDLAPLGAVLARRIVALDDRVAGAPPEVDPQAAADLVFRLDAFGHG